MRLKLLGSLVVGALALSAPSIAGAPPVVIKALGSGTMAATTIHAKAGAMLLDSITVKPGGSFGWHVHGAPVAVVVTAGTLTVLDPTVNGCKPFQVHKGQAFVEPANHLHLARNDGKTPAKAYALYMGLPNVADSTMGEHAPAACTG